MFQFIINERKEIMTASLRAAVIGAVIAPVIYIARRVYDGAASGQ